MTSSRLIQVKKKLRACPPTQSTRLALAAIVGSASDIPYPKKCAPIRDTVQDHAASNSSSFMKPLINNQDGLAFNLQRASTLQPRGTTMPEALDVDDSPPSLRALLGNAHSPGGRRALDGSGRHGKRQARSRVNQFTT